MPLGKRKFGGRPVVLRRVKRRRGFRSRKTAMARSRIGRVPVHNFRRFGNALGVCNTTTGTYDANAKWNIPAGATQAGMGCSFALTDLPSFGDFTTLYDQYQLRMVVVEIKLVTNPDANLAVNTLVTNNGSNFYPTLWYVTDRDDTVAPTLDVIKQYARSKHKVLCPNSLIKIPIRLSTLQSIYNVYNSTTSSATFSRRVNTTPTWIDVTDQSVPHYGLKMVVDFEGQTPVQYWDLKFSYKYYFKMREPR